MPRFFIFVTVRVLRHRILLTADKALHRMGGKADNGFVRRIARH